MKPMLASDVIEAKLKFPVIVQPKIDGVRGCNLEGAFTGRSLKKFANKYTTKFYSLPEFAGMDGEVAAQHECHPDLCPLTTSALTTIKGEPFTLWWLFDYVPDEATASLPYMERMARLEAHVRSLQAAGHRQAAHLRIVPSYTVNSLAELHKLERTMVEQGYEGVIIRSVTGRYKFGRSTATEGLLLRLKRFVEEDGIVVEIIEGQHNSNEAKVNELGLTERSTHKDNMKPNGLVGAMIVVVTKDVLDPFNPDRVLIAEGERVKVAAGKLTAKQRKHYFENQDELIGETIKFQFFPRGIKEKLRFPTFQSLRAPEDRV